ncbi:unnamed protein product [Thelazia callipaeda]|uniref:RH1 domain-containing protein n=1 Tax=Thelazia callipaeda TaxID=103827 RepID=A0A0N5CTT2_THECL|nr:unnamed protein product [Thelazia callipaeda]
MANLQKLCEQLAPLEIAYADVRFYDVDVEQTEQQYEGLMSLLNKELHDEKILNESAAQLAAEFELLHSKLIDTSVCYELDEILNYHLPSLQAQIQLLEDKNDDTKRNRIHVDRKCEPTVELLKKQLKQLYVLINVKLDTAARIEKDEKIAALKMTVENLRSKTCDEEELVKLEEQLQQFSVEDENVQTLAADVKKLRADKNAQMEYLKVLNDKFEKLRIRMKTLQKCKDDAHSVSTIDEKCNAFESVYNEACEILLSINELINESTVHNIDPVFFVSEYEHVKDFAKDCKVKMFLLNFILIVIERKMRKYIISYNILIYCIV